MNFVKNVFVFLSFLHLVGCATTEPFKPGKPITADGNFMSRAYIQNNKKVNFMDVTSYLKTQETTKDKATSSQTWFYAAMVPSAVGGYLIGYNLVSNSDSKSTNILLGVGLVGVSMGLAYLADKNLVEAVEIYNQKLLEGSKKNGFVVKPNISIARTSKDLSPLLGLSISF